MKIFVPASSGADSSYLLYRVLSDYDGEVVARIMRCDATTEDMENVRHVHAWLKSNVRDFDFGMGSSLHIKKYLGWTYRLGFYE